MLKFTVIGLIVFGLVGCTYREDLEKVMGRATPESSTTSPKLDCDLIFP